MDEIDRIPSHGKAPSDRVRRPGDEGRLDRSWIDCENPSFGQAPNTPVGSYGGGVIDRR